MMRCSRQVGMRHTATFISTLQHQGSHISRSRPHNELYLWLVWRLTEAEDTDNSVALHLIAASTAHVWHPPLGTLVSTHSETVQPLLNLVDTLPHHRHLLGLELSRKLGPAR